MKLKTFSLHCHLKPVTDIQISKENDLMFVSSKDQSVTVFYLKTGEMIGSYKCESSINRISVNDACDRLLAACGDGYVYMFDVKSGKLLQRFSLSSNPEKYCPPSQAVSFALGDKYFLTSTSARFGFKSQINIFKVPEKGKENPKVDVVAHMQIANPDERFTEAVWGPVNKFIVVGTEEGKVLLYEIDLDNEKADLLGDDTQHYGAINRIQLSEDGEFFLTSGYDKTAKLFETRTLELRKTYQLSEVCNTAALSPIKNHVIVGGGQASTTTTTGAKGTFYEINFIHSVFEKPVASCKAHFGPVNIVTFSHDGRYMASGGEDGYVKIYGFDRDYLSMKDDAQSMIKTL